MLFLLVYEKGFSQEVFSKDTVSAHFNFLSQDLSDIHIKGSVNIFYSKNTCISEKEGRQLGSQGNGFTQKKNEIVVSGSAQLVCISSSDAGDDNYNEIDASPRTNSNKQERKSKQFLEKQTKLQSLSVSKPNKTLIPQSSQPEHWLASSHYSIAGVGARSPNSIGYIVIHSVALVIINSKVLEISAVENFYIPYYGSIFTTRPPPPKIS